MALDLNLGKARLQTTAWNDRHETFADLAGDCSCRRSHLPCNGARCYIFADATAYDHATDFAKSSLEIRLCLRCSHVKPTFASRSANSRRQDKVSAPSFEVIKERGTRRLSV